MKALLRPAISLFVLLTLVTGVVYPMAVTAISRALFSEAAAGSLIVKGGQPVGSTLIGQNFVVAAYFWGRPSATSPFPYNGGASAGSNQGPLNPALVDAVKGRLEALKAVDPDNKLPVPIDLVTASASGLDPHISLAGAEYQIDRVARARRIDAGTVRELVNRYAESRQFGLLGEVRVNVLKLDLALDELPS
ncbi:MAG: potassium-transporting ATPase subunit KdpC [Candidatus Methylophosphatis roskildensis]